ncbi:hypothetical protein IKF33_02695 [Candidatus Saccharibacteria bacterium]|nr:hypothetical protein [Candidatus Saccharibacteria bacterium]
MDEENEALMRQFIGQMLTEKGFGDAPEETFEQMIDELEEKLIYYINRNIIAQLPAEHRRKLDVSLDDNTASFDSVNALIEESGIDTEPIIEQTLKEFKEQYLKGEMPEKEQKQEPAEEAAA